MASTYVANRSLWIGGDRSAPIRAMIETLYPTTAKLEMFARGGPVSGWRRWGNEVD